MTTYMYTNINAIINYIERNLHEKLTLTLLSKKSGYSSSYLQLKFRDIIGMSIGQYICRRRLFKTTIYLCFSLKTVSEISYLFGYSSPSVFIRLFKNEFGLTPSQFRKRKALDLKSTTKKN